MDMKMIFYSHVKKTRFHNKGLALGLTLKVRGFGTRKWLLFLQREETMLNLAAI